MMNADPLETVFTRYLPLIEPEIARTLEGREDCLLFQIIRYHLGLDQPQPDRRGKQVRPVLCLLTCEAVGGSAELAAPAAAAIELVHAFTLLHDDIADQDELRRGRPTAWRRWGVGQALTAGDALYSLASICLSRLDSSGSKGEIALEVSRRVHEAVLRLCQGQQLDLSFEGRRDVSVDDYLRMIALKTGALLAAAAEVGGLMGGADRGTVQRLRGFGHHLGVCFQICDDLLGIWGDPAKTGKPVGGDLLRRKRSLPVIYALAQGGDPGLARRLAAGLSTAEEAAVAAAEMEALGARAYAEQAAEQALANALAELDAMTLRPPYAAELRALSAYLAVRTR